MSTSSNWHIGRDGVMVSGPDDHSGRSDFHLWEILLVAVVIMIAIPFVYLTLLLMTPFYMHKSASSLLPNAKGFVISLLACVVVGLIQAFVLLPAFHYWELWAVMIEILTFVAGLAYTVSLGMQQKET